MRQGDLIVFYFFLLNHGIRLGRHDEQSCKKKLFQFLKWERTSWIFLWELLGAPSNIAGAPAFFKNGKTAPTFFLLLKAVFFFKKN